MPESGDIYKVKIFFSGTSGPFKSRPVLILDSDDEGNYTIAEITSVPPKYPPGYYDLVKEPITNWSNYGLDKQSYVKCKNVYNVKDVRLFDKIGSMKDTEEFLNIVDKIYECN